MIREKIARRISRPSKRSFAEKFYTARPEQLMLKARKLARREVVIPTKRIGLPLASNPAYIKWLKRESMLTNAKKQALRYSGTSMLWQKPYAKPRPRSAAQKASVWFTAYPVSMMTNKKQSMLDALACEHLWDVFQDVGIKGIHTGPMKISGGTKGWNITPSVDGHFDRISTRLDPLFGTEDEFRHLGDVAKRHNAIVIDDIIPGHTGKGPDFRLAEMAVDDYPGIYHMVEIDRKDWHLLPSVPRTQDSINLTPEHELQLKNAGYIIGKLQRVIFYEPGVKETNWSATRIVKGVDGKKRRWVYLHYFKDGQPSISWLDPSFAGMKLVVGDALQSIGDLGATGLRLDANGFLGLEVSSDDTPAWSEGHPLSVAANQLIASMVRKVGGFTFQELNLSIDDIKTMSSDGADLSYDFINRPAYHHAIATGDTAFLRLMLLEAKKIGIDPASLVHALQNHDELTTELVHFWTVHKDDVYSYQNQTLTGSELRDRIREEIHGNLTGEAASYNLGFTDNGIACTTASVICASLGIWNTANLSAENIKKITKAHILLAMFNAFQPGVFALSGWDLVGSMTLKPSQIPELLVDGDTRWVNRGAYKLISSENDNFKSDSGIPCAESLYGSLDTQLNDPDSFASQLKALLAVREKYGIATAHQLDIPEVRHKGLLVLVHQFSASQDLQVTVLNFADEAYETSIYSEYFQRGATVIDMFNDENQGHINSQHEFQVRLEPFDAKSFLVRV